MGLIIGAITIATVASSAIPAAVYAFHNDVGHDDKPSLGECFRAEGESKDSCQDNKEGIMDIREENRGPPNGGAADGDPPNDVAGRAHPQEP